MVWAKVCRSVLPLAAALDPASERIPTGTAAHHLEEDQPDEENRTR